MMKKVSDTQLANALILAAGIKAEAARLCKIDRSTVQARVDKSPMLQEACRKGEEQLLDISETQMVKAIKAGDGQMIRYYQDRKGKKRGYGNSLSIGTDEATLEAVVGALGGDTAALRAALHQLGVAQTEIP